MSPPRQHLCSFRFRSVAILDAQHRHRRWLRKRHTAAANSSGSKALSTQINIHQTGIDISQGADNMNHQSPFEKLPEDILHRIHSLLPVQDAACAACADVLNDGIASGCGASLI
ncbi:hypothetical protein ZWY2020_026798 [Hordeum vulgare]|nr:hypothetical protein ZWY2020_026798 [Hordeum vulgare]